MRGQVVVSAHKTDIQKIITSDWTFIITRCTFFNNNNNNQSLPALSTNKQPKEITGKDIVCSANMDKEQQQSPRRSSPVKFTIGDSSDCESVVSAAPTYEEDVTPTSTSVCNSWHKYHMKSEPPPVDKKGLHLQFNGKERSVVLKWNASGNNDDDDQEEEEEAGPSSSSCNPRLYPGFSLSTTKMVGNSDNPDLVRLSENDFRDSSVSESKLYWGRVRVVVGCAIVQLFSGLMISLQAPFYPFEAESKGANATSYGFVFAVFEMTVFVLAPFIGSRIYRWNPKIVFNVGILTAAISSIVFGLLDKIVDEKYFIAACALVRALEAVGETAVVSASFVIVAAAFHETIAHTFAWLEVFYTVGLVLGPIVGSFFYTIGGYPLPFMVVGGCLLVAATVNTFIFPSAQIIAEFKSPEPVIVSCFESFRLLTFVPTFISGLSILVGAVGISFFQATLAPYLQEQFQLSQLSIGAILTINGAAYAITAPLFGLLCSKIFQLKLVTFCGFALIVSGLSLIGPIPILPFAPTVWLIALGLFLQGIGLSVVLCASSASIIQTSLFRFSGLPDSAPTYGLLSSLWTSMFSLGSFIGPILSGTLYDLIGFPTGTLSIVILSLIMMAILLLFICTSDAEFENLYNHTENEPLISSTTGARLISSSLYDAPVQVQMVLPEPPAQPPRADSPQPGPSGTQRQLRKSYGSTLSTTSTIST